MCGVKVLYFRLVQSRHLGRAINKADQRVSELQVLIEELQWDMEKIRRRENRLNAHLIEILERVRMCSFSVSSLFTCRECSGI